MNTKIILLVLILPFVIAAKIYKWTDENGKVHFTQTPGPKQEPDKLYRDTAKKTKQKKSLTGTWYGYSSRAKYKLVLSEDNFTWTVLMGKHSSSIIGKGFYNKEDGNLIFNYTSQAFNSSIPRKQGGTADKFTIVNFSLSKLTLRSENNSNYRYIKVRIDNSTISTSHDLYGVWKNNKNGLILELLTSKFYIHSARGYESDTEYPNYTGIWILTNDKIEFQYLGDRQEIDKIGLSEKFNITYSNKNLKLENIKSGKIDSYTKQISDKRFKNKRFSF